ncbi:MAG: 5-(carboxyamino)imidazole ribonucleotide mutase [Euryarchaeota archaeon]|nr:5-(carboxyamino)imidazole ribonucleotide mutase [Euryarchaeota archaeon]
MARIAIILGSGSDMEIADQIIKVLDEFNEAHDLRMISAHRNPEELDRYVRESDALVFIAVAGLSAALPGAIAARTDRPVIGVPVAKKLGGLDALLSIVQMPPGVPVACVGIDNGTNAAHLAMRMLRMHDNT